MCDKHKSTQTALELWKRKYSATHSCTGAIVSLDTKRFMVPLTKLTTLEKLCGALTHTIPAKVSLATVAKESCDHSFSGCSHVPGGTQRNMGHI